jgi:hypothetical protein
VEGQWGVFPTADTDPHLATTEEPACLHRIKCTDSIVVNGEVKTNNSNENLNPLHR